MSTPPPALDDNLDLDLVAALAHSVALRTAMHLLCVSVGRPHDVLFTSTEDDSTELGRYVRAAIDHISRERGIPAATMTTIGERIDEMVAYELKRDPPSCAAAVPLMFTRHS